MPINIMMKKSFFSAEKTSAFAALLGAARTIFSCTTLFAAALVFSASLVSCHKKTEAHDIIELPPETKSEFSWYAFTPSGFAKSSFPDRSTGVLFKPWTESVRISDANTDSADGGLMLVNRLGVLVFTEKETPAFLQDVRLFATATAGNLVFTDGEPVFTLYRSSFFNKEAAPKTANAAPSVSVKAPLAADVNRPYIVRIARANMMFYPLLTYEDMKASDSEITGTHYDGTNWLSSIKSVTSNQTKFRYEKWQSLGSLLSLSPVGGGKKITANEINKDAYRAAWEPLPFTKAPLRLRQQLAKIPASITYSVSCKTAGGPSPRFYMHGVGDSILDSSSVISASWICTLFADGTTYFTGALNNRFIVKDGKTFAFRLPKLPANFRYTDFCISGDYLAAGWEESDFFRTGRAGFVVVNMADILYKTKTLANSKSAGVKK